MNNSKNQYGWMSIILHWLSALWLIGMFTLGYWMVELDFYSQWYHSAPHYHKSLGLIFALVIVFRMLWKLRQTSPKPLQSGWQANLARCIHMLFYLLFIGIFVSGYLISTADGRGIDIFNWFTLPASDELITGQEDIAGTWHRGFAYTLMGLATLHAFAALKHHFIDKDLTLVRMLNPYKLSKEQE